MILLKVTPDLEQSYAVRTPEAAEAIAVMYWYFSKPDDALHEACPKSEKFLTTFGAWYAPVLETENGTLWYIEAPDHRKL